MFTIGIVAHEARRQQAQQLKTTVGAAYLSEDNGTLGADGNHRTVWAWLAGHNTEPWSVVLEDDAQPVDGFREQLEQALSVAPAPVVSLYLGTGRPIWYQPRGRGSAQKIQPLLREIVARAAINDTAFITAPKLLHGVAVCMHTELITSMLASVTTSTRPIDFAISDWCEDNHHLVAYPQPSLVDHQDGPTLFRHPDKEPRTERRKAHRCGPRAAWNDRTVPL